MSEYNGWSNYETWCVNLWMSNVESDYKHYLAVAAAVLRDSEPRTGQANPKPWQRTDVRSVAVYDLARALEVSYEEAAPEVTGVYADLLGAALGSVDWYEIAEHWIDDVIENAEVEA